MLETVQSVVNQDAAHVLDDSLTVGLAVVFCGTAAGTMSARLGQYYAHPQNRFWPTLKKIGLIPHGFDKAQFRGLRTLGLGFTDIAKYASGMDSALPRGSLGREACADLLEKIAAARPAFLAFTSLTAGRAFLGPRTQLGEQAARIEATRVWVLPSPSPASRRTWDETPWVALAEAVRIYRDEKAIRSIIKMLR